jgi:hypothetical protein
MFFKVAQAQAESAVPPDASHDDLRLEISLPEQRWTAGVHAVTLPKFADATLPPAELFSQNTIFFAEIGGDRQLTLIDPAGDSAAIQARVQFGSHFGVNPQSARKCVSLKARDGHSPNKGEFAAASACALSRRRIIQKTAWDGKSTSAWGGSIDPRSFQRRAKRAR